MKLGELYEVLGTIFSVVSGLGVIAFYTFQRYRELARKELEKSNQTGENSGSKERTKVKLSKAPPSASSP